jgi:hypothetical protein
MKNPVSLTYPLFVTLLIYIMSVIATNFQYGFVLGHEPDLWGKIIFYIISILKDSAILLLLTNTYATEKGLLLGSVLADLCSGILYALFGEIRNFPIQIIVLQFIFFTGLPDLRSFVSNMLKGRMISKETKNAHILEKSHFDLETI